MSRRWKSWPLPEIERVQRVSSQRWAMQCSAAVPAVAGAASIGLVGKVTARLLAEVVRVVAVAEIELGDVQHLPASRRPMTRLQSPRCRLECVLETTAIAYSQIAAYCQLRTCVADPHRRCRCCLRVHAADIEEQEERRSHHHHVETRTWRRRSRCCPQLLLPDGSRHGVAAGPFP
jgi:hypothetical protein